MKAAAILAFCLVIPSISFSSTIYVPDDHSKIQDAINAAVDGDSIIVRPGTYVEKIDFIGKSIIVKSENGPDVTIIDGNHNGSVVRFVNGEDSAAVLEGFTIRNGNSRSSHEDGGGIYCSGASPTIKDNTISGNRARDDGGGIYCESSSMTISGNTIKLNNNVDGSGGGICVNISSSPKIADNIIIGNSAKWHGGGISVHSDSSPEITNNVIGGNSTYNGGGIDCYGASPTIRSNIITENSASTYGGGICIDSYSSPVIEDNTIAANTGSRYGGGISVNYHSSAEITDNVIVENESGRGGGIWSSDSATTVINNMIYGNSVSLEDGGGIYHAGLTGATIVNNIITMNSTARDGGGIFCLAGGMTITNNTLTRNSAGNEGGGIFCSMYNPFVRNTIVWDNTALSGPEIHHNIGADPFVSYSDVKDGWPGTGNIDADPLFVDPTNDDFHLTFNSPCKNTGDNTAVPPSLLRDFEGDRRIADGAVDIGADEFHPHLYYRGAAVPGGPISIRVVGTPTEPALLALGSGVQDPPSSTMYGFLHLQPPLLQTISLGTIPQNGVRMLTATVPGYWLPGEEKPFQALIGPLGNPNSVLTNLMALTIE